MIASGRVLVDGVPAQRAADSVGSAAQIVAEPERYVSRAAYKLLGALDDLGLSVAGRALDAGASTGGFTQVLLERGCRTVYAVDVGTGQLHDSLRRDPRVRVREQTNVRGLTLEQLDGDPVDLAVADLSFISLRLVIEPLVSVTRADGRLLLLIKPQFEVGRERLERRRGGPVGRAASDRGRCSGGGRRPGGLGGGRCGAQPTAGRIRQPGDLRVVPGEPVKMYEAPAARGFIGGRPPCSYAVAGDRPASEQDGLPGVRRVALLTHTGRPEAVAAANRLVEGLSAAGITSALPREDLPAIEPRNSAAVSVLDKPVGPDDGIELMVVLGGDGTILRGAEWVLDSKVPLLGVNLGHVGFLAEAESSEIDSIVSHVVDQSYRVEERFTIEVTLRDCESGAVVWSSYAVNEVSIEKAARERMLEVLVEIDGRPLSRWACDGMLVATPTGSTAYAFSAGGPVVWPGVDALLVVPLSAHALFARPMVLSPTSTVVVEMLGSAQTVGVVWCDGRRSVDLHPRMEIEVTRGADRLRLARLSEAPFTDRLVHKFGLRVEGWRGSPAAEDPVS